MYIYRQPNWPNFTYQTDKLVNLLSETRFRQGELLGKMRSLGFDLEKESQLVTMTAEVLESSAIEGQNFNKKEVRSSVARQLGWVEDAPLWVPHDVEGTVSILLDATQNYGVALTKERLCRWQAALFPSGYSGLSKVNCGQYRTAEMQVISGYFGKEKIHYEAVGPERLEPEMAIFLNWFNSEQGLDPLIKAAIAHLWFLTLHPFDDGNGRLARTITELQLARSEKSSCRYYSFSAQIMAEREAYYQILEASQHGTTDITSWIIWFLQCFGRALDRSGLLLEKVLQKAAFFQKYHEASFNRRQLKIINLLFDGFEGHLTSSKWAKINKCSADTALNDIKDLLERHILTPGRGGGRSSHYLFAGGK